MPPSAAADRNLLFGILALQMDFIGRDDLIAAMNAWVLDKAKPLGDILRDRHKLAADEQALLDGLVRKHLERHGNDPQQSLAAVSSLRSLRDDLRQIADADVQASLVHVAAARTGTDPNATTAESVRPPASDGMRYRILRPHAKGGLGQVSVAHDAELDREVALKEMQERHADQPALLSRFLLEAKVTGGLEHPGIVPVYGLGTYADGRPYYAMRFVRGDNLKDAIAHFHAEKDGLDPGEHTLRLRQLLGRFLDVCHAIEYAHSRGILHRDLKPGNILVGKYGETLVVDWGLAKVLDRADVESTEGVLHNPLGGDSALTQAGMALGTPAYMSPEQAAGRLDQLGPGSDVYSLGATLYCVLTGRPPFTGPDVAEVLKKVQRGDFPRPRTLERSIAPALEAVCLKAMALKPEERYASPHALAGDLEKWLADEPVSAYREPWPRRLGRWRRRHSTLVAVAAFVLLTAIVSAAIGIGVVGREQERARALAQGDALQDASAATVPFLLKEMEPHRAEVLPRLRAKWQDAALTDGQRLRVGLALADDAEVRARLVELARKAEDPQEVLLVRDALAVHAEEMRPLLWGQVKEPSTPPAERFRLLAMLATLDPDGADWPQYAGPAVEEFLGANPLHLGSWKSALEPVRAALLPPLSRAFRDSKESDRRRLIATLVADYAADRPEELIALLMDADERQYAVLFPKVQPHRERAVALLHQELDKALAPDWKDAPLDPSWPAPDGALVRQVETAEGLVAERFALCQALPLEQFDALAEGLARSGYRLLNLRPYAVATGGPPVAPRKPTGGPPVATAQMHVAAVWTRDGQAVRWAHGLTADEATKRDAAERGQGRVPLDVAGYAIEKEARYAMLWGPKEPGMEDAKLYVGVPADKHKDAWEPFQKGGFVPRTQTRVTAGSDVRLSAVWWKPARTLETKVYSSSWTEAEYESSLTPSNLQTDLRLAWSPARLEGPRNLAVATLGAAPGAGPGGLPWAALALGRAAGESGPMGLDFAPVWIDSTERVSEERHGLDPAAHLVPCRELAGRGYRPAALTVVQMGDGRVLAGSVWQRPVVPEASKDALAKRQAQAAVTLLQLGAPERVWPLLEHKPDPRLRSFLIHRLEPLKTDVQVLLGRLEEEREVSRRRALVLALGSYPAEGLLAEAREAWLKRLRQWYREEPDAGLHGATEWLLRRWGDDAEVVRIEKELAKASPGRQPGDAPPPRPWHVNGQGQTLVVVPAGAEFWMGSPGDETGRIAVNEPLHRVRIPRSFAIAAKEVTVEQFQRFSPNHRYVVKYSPRPDGPMIDVTWYQAAEYCNWLSNKEGIPPQEWCYLPNRANQYADGMRPAPAYLTKKGYRLPTEAEWEYACRAGAMTRRHYGDADELLKEYAWFAETTKSEGVRAGGLLKPNDLGLFDLYGNALEWTQDPGFLYRWPGGNKYKEDIEYNQDILDTQSRLLRGGSFGGQPSLVRSASRGAFQPSYVHNSVGFRVARTYN